VEQPEEDFVVIVIRAWLQEGHSDALRARITAWRADGHQRVLVASTPEAVCEAVTTTLDELFPA